MSRPMNFQQKRAYAVLDLERAKSSSAVSYVRLLVSEDACEICLERSHLVFPIKSCQLSDLPPYRRCKLKHGCESTFTCDLDEFEGNTAPAPPGIVWRFLVWLVRLPLYLIPRKPLITRDGCERAAESAHRWLAWVITETARAYRNLPEWGYPIVWGLMVGLALFFAFVVARIFI